MSILDFFPAPPLPGFRNSQKLVLEEVESAIKAGYTFILIEGAVGCGKSAIAIAIARWAKSAHILTPMKSLQDQYFEDFNMYTVLMKGRSSYPCVYGMDRKDAKDIRDKISSGGLIHVERTARNCGQGPCKDSADVYAACTGFDGEKEKTPCPYTIAIETAQRNDLIIHNLHSYIYQTHFGGRFTQRKVMIIDEAHRIENILRDFAQFKLSLPGLLGGDEERDKWENFEDIDDWLGYFSQARFLPQQEEPQKAYLERLNSLENLVNDYPSMWSRFAVNCEEMPHVGATRFVLTPEKLGGLPQRLLYDGGEINVIMSGTIYDKTMFCRDRGIDPDKAYFIRIGSSFPVSSRPVIMKPEYMAATSHKDWMENIPDIAQKIRNVMDVFKDAKGLIHAPSYRAAVDIVRAVNDPRLITHVPEDFQERLAEFYRRTDNSVFVSPVCVEGVDFKHDRARFQIVTRIPYLNAGDPFISMKLKSDFAWYNYQALISFGQQMGRVNRSEDDFGVSILMDDRFPAFIRKNKSKIPKWLQDAIKTK